MRKMCPRCSVIFEATPASNFCSERCKTIFHSYGLHTLKGRSSVGPEAKPLQFDDGATEITRPAPKIKQTIVAVQ